MEFDRALIIDEPWIDLILQGIKSWEMRTRKTNKRGTIGLIRKGSGLIVGSAFLANSLAKINLYSHVSTYDMHKIPYETGKYDKWLYPWVFSCVQKFNKPIPYKHPRGAVIWVKV